MKALVLSGGTGSRLRPITHTFAKQLIPIANKPILFYGLEAIAAAGIKEVGVVVGDTHQEIRRAVGDGSVFGLKVTYIHQEAPLGLAHAVKISRDFLKEDSFVMYLGDNLLKSGLEGVVEAFEAERPNSQILVARVPNPQQFGVVELRGDVVVSLQEKPLHPRSDLALVGVYLFDKNIHRAVESIRPSGRGELEITDAIQWLVDNKFRVVPRRIDGWWKDTGKLEDLLEANRILLEGAPDSASSNGKARIDSRSKLEGRVIFEEGVELVESTIRGPAIIGKNTKIIRSYIGPFTSISHDVLVEDSELEHSILLESSTVKGIRRIQDSLIGQRVK